MHELPLPKGSKIEIVDDVDGRTYCWLRPASWIVRVFVSVLFSVLLLVAWTAGLVNLVGELKNANDASRIGGLLLWLALWAAGGLFGMFMLYLFARPRQRESITLMRESFYYDSGTAPPVHLFYPGFGMQQTNPSESRFFDRRKQVEKDRHACEIIFARGGPRPRLYFDDGADRIEIGQSLREPEREWLAAVISDWQERPGTPTLTDHASRESRPESL